MISIYDEYYKFISLTDILIRIAIAQDAEISIAANTLIMTLKKDKHWQNVKFNCFCMNKGMSDVTNTESELIIDMLEMLAKDSDADSIPAYQLRKICNATLFESEDAKYTDNCQFKSSTQDFLEYHNELFDIYGFSLDKVQLLLQCGESILFLKDKKHKIQHDTIYSEEEKSTQVALIDEEIKSLIKILDTPKSNTKPADTKETTFLNIIAVLLEIIHGQHGGSKHPDFNSQAELINEIETKYKGYSGVSKRTLEDKFAQAKKSLK